jgi:hypothetical protein
MIQLIPFTASLLMPFQAPSANGKGLPTVLPPSGTHIVKLFIVPLLIVGGLLLGAFLFLKITGGSVVRSPQSFLAELRSDNPDVRWRAAQDLAQVLTRDDRLASDALFGLELTADLRKALDETEAAEKTIAEELQKDPEANVVGLQKDLEANRNYILYLTACEGNLCTPVGAQLLTRLAVDGGAGPSKVRTTRRWRSLWALANLGDNLKRFDALSPERQDTVISEFAQIAGLGDERASVAVPAATYLKGRREGRPPSLGVEEVLVRCSADPNPFLREIAVFALNFWDGGAGVEEALVARLEDRGDGEEQLTGFYEGEPSRDTHFTKMPGLRIRYNAAVALARRGSGRTPVDVLREMLDESEQLEQNLVRFKKDGRQAADEATARDVVKEALGAVAELHRKNPAMNLSSLDSAIDKLKSSSDASVRKEAERTEPLVRQ